MYERVAEKREQELGQVKRLRLLGMLSEIAK